MRMSGTKHAYVNDEYRLWQQTIVTVRGQSIVLASKPGVFAHGSIDPSSLLLAQHVRVDAGDVFVNMNCRNGLLGSAIALSAVARRVALTDRNVLAVEASSRTLSANGVDGAEVYVGHGAAALPDLAANVVAIRIPQEKPALLQLLHDAFGLLEAGGRVYLAGATNEGIKSAARTLEQIFGNAATIATESGHRVVSATKRADQPAGDDIPSSPYLDADAFLEQSFDLRGNTHAFFSRPGVFSWDHLDEATAVLVEHMDVQAGDRVLDLGCGYGVLGVVAGCIADAPVTMVDVDSEAVRSAARSAAAAGLGSARAIGSDVASAVLEEQFDLVVTNPPFHVGKATDLSVPIQFIADAYAVLAPGGRLNLVANRTLPYEGAIKYLFKNITTVHDGRRFKVLTAVKAP
ncbi:MAG: methyltransferase [Gemmatimonadaceae bacterium]